LQIANKKEENSEKDVFYLQNANQR